MADLVDHPHVFDPRNPCCDSIFCDARRAYAMEAADRGGFQRPMPTAAPATSRGARRRRLDVMRERVAFLRERIGDRSEISAGRDRAEVAALEWAILEIEAGTRDAALAEAAEICTQLADARTEMWDGGVGEKVLRAAALAIRSSGASVDWRARALAAEARVSGASRTYHEQAAQLRERDATIEDLRGEVVAQTLVAAEAMTDAERAKERQRCLGDETRKANQERDAALSKLRVATSARDDVWFWEDGGENDPESLSCPVVMRAQTLREILGLGGSGREDASLESLTDPSLPWPKPGSWRRLDCGCVLSVSRDSTRRSRRAGCEEHSASPEGLGRWVSERLEGGT